MNTSTARLGSHIITKTRLVVCVAVLSSCFLIACETTSHEQQGEIIGGVIGGVLGSQVGDGSGRTLNDNRTNQSATWVNPDTGYEYTVTPTRTFEEAGSPCREFRLDATVGDQSNQDVYGTACLQTDGS
jgi:surface antigen